MEGVHITKKNIIDFLGMQFSPLEIVRVEHFDTVKTRHICDGRLIKKNDNIKLLSMSIVNFPLPQGGFIPIRVFFCPICRKLIVEECSIDLL